MINSTFAAVALLVMDRRVQAIAAIALALVVSVVLGGGVTEAKPVIAGGPHH